MVYYDLSVKNETIQSAEDGYLFYAEAAYRLGINNMERIEVRVRMDRHEGELSFHTFE
jgi:hypothetical protein